MQVAYPHEPVALDSVPDHPALQAQKQSSLRHGINLVEPFVAATKTPRNFTFFGHALRVNVFQAIRSAAEFEADESEPGLPVAPVGKLRERNGKIAERMVVRCVFNAERRKAFRKGLAETNPYGRAVFDIMRQKADSALNFLPEIENDSGFSANRGDVVFAQPDLSGFAF